MEKIFFETFKKILRIVWEDKNIARKNEKYLGESISCTKCLGIKDRFLENFRKYLTKL